MSHYRPRDGKDGTPGTHGKDGERGPMGPQGQKGEPGEDGKDGQDGSRGDQGPQGERGERGQQGERGPRGLTGPRGEVGPMPEHEWDGTSLRFEEPDGWGEWVNLKGEKGDKGEPGRNGVGGVGPRGPEGPQGPPGPGGSGTIEAGDGIDVATVGDVTTVSHGDTSSIADFANGFTGGVVMQQYAITFDQFGHVQTVGVLGTDLDVRYVQIADQIASTDDLPEGSANLYFTNERAQDAVGNNLLDTATVNLTYNDGTGQISADVDPAGVVLIAGAQTVIGTKTFTSPIEILGAGASDVNCRTSAAVSASTPLGSYNGGDTANLTGALTFRGTETWTGSAKGTRAQVRVTANGGTTLTEIASFNSNGFGVGTSTPNYTGFTTAITVEGTSNCAYEMASTRADASGVLIGAFTANYRTNSAGHQRICDVQFQTDMASPTANQRGGSVTIWTKPDASTTLTKRLEMDAAGNMAFGTSGSYGGGVRVISVQNASTVPTSNPTGGGVMYAEAGAGKWRGSSGTVTTFGPANPHCPECGSDFVREYESPLYGYLARCDNCAANGINSHTRIKGAWDTHGN